MNHNLEDLLDEIDEDAVIEILEDSNELGGLLKAVAACYDGDDEDAWDEVQSFLNALMKAAIEIRKGLVRIKYPLADNNPNQ